MRGKTRGCCKIAGARIPVCVPHPLSAWRRYYAMKFSTVPDELRLVRQSGSGPSTTTRAFVAAKLNSTVDR